MKAVSRAGFLAAVAVGAVPVAVNTVAPAAVLPTAISPLKRYGTYAHGSFLPATPGPVFRGGVIRFDLGGPKLYVNAAHQSVGIIPSSVRINAQGHLEFHLDTTLPVISCSADPDETLVQRDVSAGISGGGSLCVVKMRVAGMARDRSLNLNVSTDYSKVKGSTSNMWISVQSYSGGAL